MTEPRFDVSFQHVPAAVHAEALHQATLLSEVLGLKLTVKDTLVAQRRLGEAVISAWLCGQLVGLTEMVKEAADTRTIKRRSRPKPVKDKRQMALFKEGK